MPEVDVYADRDAAPEMEAEEVETKDSEDAPDKKDEGDGDGDDKSSESATALVSKSFFNGKDDLKPGTKCSVEIVKSYDDQISIRYIQHVKSDDKDSEDEDEVEVEEEVYD